MIDQSQWFAFRLKPQATRLARDYWVHVGERDGRYLRNTVSGEMNIARSAAQHGLDVYVPMLMTVRRHSRTNRPIYTYSPMMSGFGFIRGVVDFQALDEVDYLGAPLGVNGKPIAVNPIEMLQLQNAEAAQHKSVQDAVATKRAENVRRYLQKRSQRDLTKKKLSETYTRGVQIHIIDGPFAGQKAVVESATGRQSVNAMMQIVGKLVPIEVPVKQIVEVGADIAYKVAV